MQKYCRIVPIGRIEHGDFHELWVQAISGESLHKVDAFLDALAIRIMRYYESQPYDDLLEIAPSPLDKPAPKKDFYRRLFEEDGRYRPDFITIASETVGAWIEESLEPTLIVHPGEPHNSDPGFDVLSIYKEEGIPRLRVVQVKATENALQKNCSDALSMFERLEKGDFEAELSSRLKLILNQKGIPDGLRARDLKLNKRYRVTVVHGQERDDLQIMTTYSEKVRGEVVRRSSVLMKIGWPGLWEQIARRIYAKLT
jgi:hypothetical protein